MYVFWYHYICIHAEIKKKTRNTCVCTVLYKLYKYTYMGIRDNSSIAYESSINIYHVNIEII